MDVIVAPVGVVVVAWTPVVQKRKLSRELSGSMLPFGSPGRGSRSGAAGRGRCDGRGHAFRLVSDTVNVIRSATGSSRGRAAPCAASRVTSAGGFDAPDTSA